jgi:hypothetical protein
MNTNITKRIHINPQSKGSLGKSFEAEFRTAWLDYHDIHWNGSDLDDRHHSFADRHPEQVHSYTLVFFLLGQRNRWFASLRDDNAECNLAFWISFQVLVQSPI